MNRSVVDCRRCGGKALDTGAVLVCYPCLVGENCTRVLEEAPLWNDDQLTRALARPGMAAAAEQELLRRWAKEGG